jgi:hypothetical protein
VSPGTSAKEIARLAARIKSPVANRARELATRGIDMTLSEYRADAAGKMAQRLRFNEILKQRDPAYPGEVLMFDRYNASVTDKLDEKYLSLMLSLYEEYGEYMAGDNRWSEVVRLGTRPNFIDELELLSRDTGYLDRITERQDRPGHYEELITKGSTIAESNHLNNGFRYVVYQSDLPANILNMREVVDAMANKAYVGSLKDAGGAKEFIDAFLDWAEDPDNLEKLIKMQGMIRKYNTTEDEFEVHKRLVMAMIDITGGNKYLRLLVASGLDRLIAWMIPGLQNPARRIGGARGVMHSNTDLYATLQHLVDVGFLKTGDVPKIRRKKWLTTAHGIPAILQLFGLVLGLELFTEADSLILKPALGS